MRRTLLLLAGTPWLATGFAADPSVTPEAENPYAVWIERLGSPRFTERREAMRWLTETDNGVIPHLRRAAGDDDIERRTRARLLLGRRLRPVVVKRLQGDWRYVEIVEDEVVKSKGLGALLRFDGSRCTIVPNEDNPREYPANRYSLDVVPVPFHIDLVMNGKPCPGLLQLDGDELQITYGMLTNQPRPGGIDAKRTKGLRYFRLERVDPDDGE